MTRGHLSFASMVQRTLTGYLEHSIQMLNNYCKNEAGKACSFQLLKWNVISPIIHNDGSLKRWDRNQNQLNNNLMQEKASERRTHR